MPKVAGLFFLLLVLAACGAAETSTEPTVGTLRGFDGEEVDATSEVDNEETISRSVSAPSSLPFAEDSKRPERPSGSPLDLCDAPEDHIVGRLIGGELPATVLVAPPDLFDAGTFATIDDNVEAAQGVVTCVNSLAPIGNSASCGAVEIDGDLVRLERIPRRVSLTWHSGEAGDDPVDTPPLLLFEQCPDIDTSDPLFHSNYLDLQIVEATSTLDTAEFEDALLPSLTAYVALDKPSLSASRCQALTLTDERGRAAMSALASAFGSADLQYPGPGSRVGTSAELELADELVPSYSQAAVVASEELEGDPIRLLIEPMLLNSLVWNRLISNAQNDVSANGEEWFRWKLGRQLGVGFNLSNRANLVALLGQVVQARCAGVEAVVEVFDSGATCRDVAELYYVRHRYREMVVAGDNALAAAVLLFERGELIKELHPANSNPFFDDAAIDALFSLELALDAALNDSEQLSFETVRYAEQFVELDDFAHTCAGIPEDHLSLPSVFEAAGTSIDEVAAREGERETPSDALAPDAVPAQPTRQFDERLFLEAIDRIELPDGWVFNGAAQTMEERLDEVLADTDRPEFGLGVLPEDPTTFIIGEEEEIRAAREFIRTELDGVMTAAGFTRTEVICDGERDFEWFYESSDGSTGSVLVSSFPGIPPVFISFGFPGVSVDTFLSAEYAGVFCE